MKRVLLAAQLGFFAVVFVWVLSGSGCGAKSTLLVPQAEEEEEVDPSVVPPVDCEQDLDCDDGLFCNGVERCVDALCEDGEPVDCGEGDDCHMVYCDDTRAECVEMLVAEDDDGDGFYAAPCGEDCDDSNPEIYPGAREVCNGLDDNCDGLIDEDLVQDCEDFGRQICIDGEWTECMTCTVCIPGSWRYCDTPSYCSWGRQTCNDAGDGWGPCDETSAPSSCTGSAYDQECCLAAGYCCQDYFDFDGDGDWDESLGACEDVNCPTAR
jgi:hypothetical protein